MFQSRLFKRGLVCLGLFVLWACALAGCAAPKAATTGPGLPLEPCQLGAPGTSTRLPAKCGTLTVYEDRAAQAGRQINLRIAVIPTLSRAPAPDPLFFITGGPGGAATVDYLQMSAAFSRINEKRDIVLVDQRGTGQSHPLECAGLDEEPEADDEQALQAWLEACLGQLDADPRFYTTQAAVDDLEQVRQALGYGQINLYGISYGTRVALTYMRSYPHNVRAAILDGVVPQDEALGTSIASDAQKALDAILARCVADADCNQAFPDLSAALEALLQRVEKEPITLTIEHPATGQPTELKFTRDSLGVVIRLFSYNPETVALLPLLIYDAQTTGDFSRIAAQSLLVSQQLEGNLVIGMHHSVVCAEDVPFYVQQGSFVGDVEAEKRAYLGEFYRDLEKICAYWPAGQVQPEFKEPVRSDTPVLLLSGEIDPVTPPANAEQAAKTLTHSLHVVAPGQGHGVILRGCVHRVAASFIEQGTVDGLGTDCVKAMEPPPFFLSFTGSAP